MLFLWLGTLFGIGWYSRLREGSETHFHMAISYNLSGSSSCLQFKVGFEQPTTSQCMYNTRKELCWD